MINLEQNTPIQETGKPTNLLDWKAILQTIKTKTLIVFRKFYSNKKIFWLVNIVSGLLLLVVILGLLFGKTKNNQAVAIPTATPYILMTPEATASGDILTDTKNKLIDLRKKINDLDVGQSRLSAPNMEFDVRF